MHWRSRCRREGQPLSHNQVFRHERSQSTGRRGLHATSGASKNRRQHNAISIRLAPARPILGGWEPGPVSDPFSPLSIDPLADTAHDARGSAGLRPLHRAGRAGDALVPSGAPGAFWRAFRRGGWWGQTAQPACRAARSATDDLRARANRFLRDRPTVTRSPLSCANRRQTGPAKRTHEVEEQHASRRPR